MNEITIANYKIGINHPTFIIAELSANHNQDFDIAVKTIHAMKKAGADAVKIQTYTADTITLNCDNDYFKIKGTIWEGKTLHELYQEAYTPWGWQAKLQKVATDIGLVFFSSPFDFSAVDFLENLNVPAYKIASFEINDIPLIRYIAKKNKPIIFSTGIATLEDINLALNTCRKVGNEQIALLKCISEYPANYENMNLNTIPDYYKKFDTVIGLSDHSIGSIAPVVAVSLGARIVEKHFILNKEVGGPDASFSLTPDEFKKMVVDIRNTEKALGRVSYDLSDSAKLSKGFSRSLFVSNAIKKGEQLSPDNIKSVRPANGLAPQYYDDVLGKIAKLDIPMGTPLSWDQLEH